MTKSLNDCLRYLEDTLYKDNNNQTQKCKEHAFILIKHLSIKDINKLKELLNKIIFLKEKKDNLLTHRGLLLLLSETFTEEILDFYETEKTRKWVLENS